MSGHPRLWNADDAVLNLFGIPESQITAATETAGRAKESLGVGRRRKNQGRVNNPGIQHGAPY